MSKPSAAVTWRQKAITALKAIWMLVALAAFITYITSNIDQLQDQLTRITPLRLIIAFSLVLVGRLLMIVAMRLILFSGSYTLRFKWLVYIFAITDLAKYLPGGIWHFVGRAGYYHNEGIPALKVTRFLLLENLWLMVSATLTGSSLLILGLTTGNSWLAVPALLVIWAALIHLSRTVAGWLATLKLISIQITIWLMFGASFAVIVTVIPPTTTPLTLMGAFVVSWVIGFVSLFAPGGIGVREVALTALLLPIMAAENALALSVLHRFIWILVELLLGLYAWMFLKQR